MIKETKWQNDKKKKIKPKAKWIIYVKLGGVDLIYVKSKGYGYAN